MREPFGTAVAIAACALVPPIAMCVGSPSYYGSPGVLVAIALLSYQAAIAASFIFGVPLLLLGLRLGQVAWWTATLAGFLVGVLMDFVIHLPALMPEPVPEAVSAGALGSATGLMFWVVRRFALGRSGSPERVV